MSITDDMPTNDPIGEIHEAMAAVLDELPAIGKDSSNEALKFRFRGIEAIVNALNPLLGKHGVVPRLYRSQLLQWEPKTKGYAAVVLNTYHFTARDGSWVEAQSTGEGHDFGDKAVAKANTMAQKTCLGQTFCLAFEDDPDGDTVTEDEPKAPDRTTGAEAPVSAPPPGQDVEQLRGEVWSTIEGLTPEGKRKVKGWMLSVEGIGHTDVAKYNKAQLEALKAWIAATFEDAF